MFIVYLLSMGLYYNHTHSIIIRDTEKHIEDILVSRRALAQLVSDIQKPEVNRLKSKNFLHTEYFSSELLSSSYITLKLNEYTNKERQKVNLEPISFKYASPNPTNTKNLANDFEQKIYNQFNTNNIQKYKEVLTQDDKTYLYYAIAERRIEQKCLQCHGLVKDAPQMMINRYGTDNGFGKSLGELSAIISINIPLTDIYKENDKEFFIIALIIFFTFIVLLFLSEKLKNHLKMKEDKLLHVNKTLMEDINKDPLTSLLNRRSFEEQFLLERDRAKRDNKKFAFMMIDIDFFKHYNDDYGHVQGDRALQKVAQSLQKSFRRSSDLIFRIGGEEFAVLSVGESFQQLINSADKACERLFEEHIPHRSSDIGYLSISIGLALIDENYDITFLEAYELSDKTLYEAKKSGRNQMKYIKLRKNT